LLYDPQDRLAAKVTSVPKLDPDITGRGAFSSTDDPLLQGAAAISAVSRCSNVRERMCNFVC
jgi:hypothetical protein